VPLLGLRRAESRSCPTLCYTLVNRQFKSLPNCCRSPQCNIDDGEYKDPSDYFAASHFMGYVTLITVDDVVNQLIKVSVQCPIINGSLYTDMRTEFEGNE
jgi:hypothetical protein